MRISTNQSPVTTTIAELHFGAAFQNQRTGNIYIKTDEPPPTAGTDLWYCVRLEDGMLLARPRSEEVIPLDAEVVIR